MSEMPDLRTDVASFQDGTNHMGFGRKKVCKIN